MAVGTQFSVLVTRLRAALRRSTSVAVGVDDLDSLKQTLNQHYDLLYAQHDWPHLKKVFDLELVATERYYDLPTGLNPDRIEAVDVNWSGTRHPVRQGIGLTEMEAFDSDATVPEQSEPALRYDIRWTGTSTQIEVWPIPSTGDQTLRFRGVQAITPLVNDADTCLLDDTLVVLYAAAELAAGAGAKDAEFKAQAAREYLQKLKGRGATNAVYRLGLGDQRTELPHRIVVRVGS